VCYKRVKLSIYIDTKYIPQCVGIFKWGTLETTKPRSVNHSE
jgi:hypothetical protein